MILSFVRLSGSRSAAVPVGHVTVAGATGLNRFRFRGRAGTRRLGPGRYGVSARATDQQGLHSATRRATFILKR